jgi:hypothetical protein
MAKRKVLSSNLSEVEEHLAANIRFGIAERTETAKKSNTCSHALLFTSDI